MMSEYKIGYVMKVTKKDDFYFGRIGKIEDRSSNPRQFCLRFAPGNMTAWFYAHELIHLQPDEIPFPERTELAPAQPATADVGAEIHASELVQLGYELGRYGATTETRAAAVQTYIDTRTADLEAKLAAVEALAATNASLLANAKHELDAVREWVKVCEDNWHDNGAALAAILDERGMTELTIGGRYVYKTMDGSAASFAVDAQGNRVQQASAHGKGEAG